MEPAILFAPSQLILVAWQAAGTRSCSAADLPRPKRPLLSGTYSLVVLRHVMPIPPILSYRRKSFLSPNYQERDEVRWMAIVIVVAGFPRKRRCAAPPRIFDPALWIPSPCGASSGEPEGRNVALCPRAEQCPAHIIVGVDAVFSDSTDVCGAPSLCGAQL
ncbi:hypothetical protein SCP_1402190 [Sparassis crispa]|uniref:Secreted protein n=1 Tax=Sparassis crispa TaxID=139825 RepID=A0A401H328_9APHY|nr:hypothetical protein SCP_1402190 [Sparassis crispa]GBE88814.1 hypothetical protein SCP_1402190 [Sparassis crispa]